MIRPVGRRAVIVALCVMAGAAALAAVGLTVGRRGSSGTRTAVSFAKETVGTRGTGGAYTVRYPAKWSAVPVSAALAANSPGLSMVVRGQTRESGCPAPLLLVRDAVQRTEALDATLGAFNRVEKIRRPSRRVSLVEHRTITGMRDSVLVTAAYVDTSGAKVQTYDLLAQGTNGYAYHLFTSGCPRDLPPALVTDSVLSLEPATR